MRGAMPNITQAQVLAGATWVAAQAVATGWINNDQAASLVQITGTVVAAAWIIGDALIRWARNKRAAEEAHAEAAKAHAPKH